MPFKQGMGFSPVYDAGQRLVEDICVIDSRLKGIMGGKRQTRGKRKTKRSKRKQRKSKKIYTKYINGKRR